MKKTNSTLKYPGGSGRLPMITICWKTSLQQFELTLSTGEKKEKRNGLWSLGIIYWGSEHFCYRMYHISLRYDGQHEVLHHKGKSQPQCEEEYALVWVGCQVLSH